MKIIRSDLTWAVDQGIITTTQAASLWEALTKRYEHQPRFTFGHIIYYLGALLVISSMSWFMVTAWERLGGGGIFVVSASYAALFCIAGRNLWQKPAFRIPGGLLYTAAVWMTPLAVYGFQRMLGWWPQGDPGTYRDYHIWVKGSWFFMEVATILVGALVLRKVKFPFITFPIAFALWYMSMDLTPLLFGKTEFSWNERKWVSVVFGATMLVGTYFIDRKTKEDFAFWGYLFGLLAFWGGLSAMNSNSELGKLIYCLINLFLIFLSVFLGRKAFAVLGAIGMFGYFGHLAHSVFKDVILFPFALSLLGIFVIFLGVTYQKNQERIENWFIRSLPETLRKLRPLKRC